MDKLRNYRGLVTDVLEAYYRLSLESEKPDLETELLMDEKRDQYLLLRMGWRGDERIKRNLIHVRLREEKIWVEEDRTEDGVATDFLQAGVPRQDIVLAFHPPRLRQHTEFATA